MPPSTEPKKIRVEIVPPGAAAMAAVAAAPPVAATVQAAPEAVSSNGAEESKATRKPRRTRLDRLQDCVQKARDMLSAMDLGGGTLDGFLDSAIKEISSVKATGFKPPRKRRQLTQIWLKPEFITAAGMDETWKKPLNVINVTDGGMVHAEGPEGAKMFFRKRDFSTKDPNAVQAPATA